MASSDSLFSTLPLSVRQSIDRAFDATVNPDHNPTHRNRKAHSTPATGGGGFLIEDPAPPGGGFIVEDAEEEAEERLTEELASAILLRLIPEALQRLDLPPDDPEILSVFKNAASGWTSHTITPSAPWGDQDLYVKRDDWRVVCAVLLEHRHDEDDAIGGAEDVSDPHEMQSDGDAYMSDDYEEDRSPSSASENGGEDSDEYMEGCRRTRAMQRKPKNKRPSSPSRPETLTARQKETCLKTFALFFPDVVAEDIPNQRIMIKDIQRAAKVLGEKIKPEEMIEMLEMFSTSPDKSMNLDDFSRMMITAKLA